jgi:hypothetical protein
MRYPASVKKTKGGRMTASHDRRTETEASSAGARRSWTAPAVRRMAAGSAEAGGNTVPDGEFGKS